MCGLSWSRREITIGGKMTQPLDERRSPARIISMNAPSRTAAVRISAFVAATALSIASQLGAQTPAGVTQPTPHLPYVAAQRTDQNSMIAHEQLLAKRTQGKIDVYFEGNSIVRRWGGTDYPDYLANFKTNFFGWNAADFGWGADATENVLWRLENGELDGVNPKVIVLLIGTNNVGNHPGDDKKVADITRGMRAL